VNYTVEYSAFGRLEVDCICASCGRSYQKIGLIVMKQLRQTYI